MMEKGQWKEKDKVFGLPKIKTVRIKIKKEKVKEAVEAPTAEVAPGEAAAPAGAESKEQAPAKGPATKGQEKK
jgi:hypothetical protein